MDPISSLISGHVAGKLMDYIQSKFKTHVIERWTKRRAERFFEEFCREVQFELAGKRSDKLDQVLNKILEDKTCSEVLFDAYRRVCFTKSNDFGPRIIGIITAKLVLEERSANEIEDNMLVAAENLTDSELDEFSEYTREKILEGKDDSKKDVHFNTQGDLVIYCGGENFDSNWRSRTETSVAPMDLNEFGRWAVKLKSFGIISDDVKERQYDYQEDSERYIDEPGTVREVSWWLYIPKAYFRFIDIIERVSRMPSNFNYGGIEGKT